MTTPCRVHDIPDGARYCIRCGAAIAAEGRTERLDGMVIHYVNFADWYSLMCHTNTYMVGDGHLIAYLNGCYYMLDGD